MVDESLWKEFGPFDRPYYLAPDDRCFYARDYTSRGGYSASQGNQLIANLKKKPHLRKTNQWRHKLSAIAQFSRELAALLGPNAVVTAIPPSKCSDHQEFDPRITEVLNKLIAARPDIRLETPIRRIRSVPAQHEREERQAPDEVYLDLEWSELSQPTNHLILVDDVITTGSTYKACSRLIRENCGRIDIFGAFWARTVWTPSA